MSSISLRRCSGSSTPTSSGWRRTASATTFGSTRRKVQEEHGSGLLEKAREKTSELVGRRPEPGLLLVRDLRKLHLLYAEASINYVILGQGAQAARDRELLDACSQCHPQTLRGMKWTVTRIKTASPQVLTS